MITTNGYIFFLLGEGEGEVFHFKNLAGRKKGARSFL